MPYLRKATDGAAGPAGDPLPPDGGSAGATEIGSGEGGQEGDDGVKEDP